MLHKNSFSRKNDRLRDLTSRKKSLSAAWNRIVSDGLEIALVLLLNYRDTRTELSQNAKEISSNDSMVWSMVMRS